MENQQPNPPPSSAWSAWSWLAWLALPLLAAAAWFTIRRPSSCAPASLDDLSLGDLRRVLSAVGGKASPRWGAAEVRAKICELATRAEIDAAVTAMEASDA